MSIPRLSVVTVLVVLTTSSPRAGQEHQHPAGEKIGTVNFETTCNAKAQPEFNRAMALMHSFEFGNAIKGFTAAATVDAGCAMAHWGVAISRWGNPFAASIRPPAQLQQGQAAIAQAQKAGAKSDRERAYIDAASKLFADSDRNDQRARVVAYERAMAALAAAYPKDREASIFWALSLTASALPSDKTYANQLKAASILEPIYTQAPDHPGVTHYIIHTFDVPPLANRAIKAAHHYSTIAPSSPHALHMPSHTFTRVGDWQASIASNLRSAEESKRQGATAEELHATDYLAYAYLQSGNDAAVQRLIASLVEIGKRFDPAAVTGAAPGSAGLFAQAAIPARWALEHRDWAAAARLESRASIAPYTEALTHFARALGAAQTGARADAQTSIKAIEEVRDRLAKANEAYWTEQVEIQRDIANAFLAKAEGRTAEAVSLMRAASDREDRTEKNAVTPGPLAPARELLGDMLLETKEPALALKEFRAVLVKEPNRFRAVYGAAKAAASSNDTASARTYYRQLIALCPKASTPERAELVEARKYK